MAGVHPGGHDHRNSQRRPSCRHTAHPRRDPMDLTGALAATGLFAGLASAYRSGTNSAAATTNGTASSASSNSSSAGTGSSSSVSSSDDNSNSSTSDTVAADNHPALDEQRHVRDLRRVVSHSADLMLWYLARATGVVAILLLSGSITLGIVVTMRPKIRNWPRWMTEGLHRNISLLATCSLGMHILTTVIDPVSPVHLVDTLVPFSGSYRRLAIGLGVVAVDLLAAVVITSLLRNHISHRVWKAVRWRAGVHVLAVCTSPRSDGRHRRVGDVERGRLRRVYGRRGRRRHLAALGRPIPPGRPTPGAFAMTDCAGAAAQPAGRGHDTRCSCSRSTGTASSMQGSDDRTPAAPTPRSHRRRRRPTPRRRRRSRVRVAPPRHRPRAKSEHGYEIPSCTTRPAPVVHTSLPTGGAHIQSDDRRYLPRPRACSPSLQPDHSYWWRSAPGTERVTQPFTPRLRGLRLRGLGECRLGRASWIRRPGAEKQPVDDSRAPQEVASTRARWCAPACAPRRASSTSCHVDGARRARPVVRRTPTSSTTRRPTSRPLLRGAVNTSRSSRTGRRRSGPTGLARAHRAHHGRSCRWDAPDVTTDGTWRIAGRDVRTPAQRRGRPRRAHRRAADPGGWDQPGFDDRTWPSALVLGPHRGHRSRTSSRPHPHRRTT